MDITTAVSTQIVLTLTVIVGIAAMFTSTCVAFKRHLSNPMCFRIRMIPKHWDEEKLRNELYKVDAELRDHNITLSICSSSSKSSTALLEFADSGTKFFRSLSPNEDHTVLGSLLIDQHFLGFTVLHSPAGKVSAEYARLLRWKLENC